MSCQFLQAFRRLLIPFSFILGAFNLSGQDPSELLKDNQPSKVEEPTVEKEPAEPVEVKADVTGTKEFHRVYRVPIEDAISKPNLYILRRSLKQAIEENVDVIVIDMDTPGGRLDVTLEMMELLDRFEGETLTFVNKDAISAGAYISMATDAIYFAPNGVMGAAAVVSGSGEEIDPSMKAKINSYLLARMRSYTDEYPYRAEVIRAMADLDYELKIDEDVLKKPGELLSVTANEAVKLYGDPQKPLLADGIVDDIESLLETRYGDGQFEVVTFEISWAEEVAKYLDSIAPILMGIGILALFIEFKTPGFGIAGIAGILLIATVFVSNYFAGLAGMEGILVFLLGLVLVVVDILLLPGTFIFLIIGVFLIIGSLVFSLADFWPVPEGDDSTWGFTVDGDSVWMALYEILGAFAIAVIGLMILWKFLPKTPVYGRLVHQSSGPMPDPVVTGGGSALNSSHSLPDVGSEGTVTKALHPLGEVEINGERYEATVGVGIMDKGEKVVVTGYRSFSLLVSKKEG